MNTKVVLEYDGAGFSGWQQQVGRRTVEAELKRALKDLTGKDHKVYGAGRTDAGAHALGQVASFRLEGRIAVSKLADALNARLPEDRYRYRYLDRRPRPALERGLCWHVAQPLDERLMAEAAAILAGRHDWTSFCSPGERNPIREMRSAKVAREGRFVELELVAEGFLRGLARGIAGALAEVGAGRRPPGWVGELMEARDRSQAPKTAPARGLTLVEVIYK